MKMLILPLLVMILSFTVPTHATIINVSTLAELQDAVANLRSGDTVLIADGNYDLQGTLVINNKPEKIHNVAIMGRSGVREAVKIFCPGMGVESENAPHVFSVNNVENLLISDLTAGRTYWHPITVQGQNGPENVHFRNLHLIDAGEQFIKVNNGGEEKCDNGIVEGCLIEYTDYAYWNGDYYYTQGFDKIGGGDNWIVRDCVFRNIRPHPEHVNEAGGCGAPITFWQGGSNNLIERNIIINCRKGIELGIGEGNGVDNSIVRNNVVYREAGEVGGDIGISVNDSPNAKILNNTVILNGTFNPGGTRTIEYRFTGTTNLEIKNNLCDGDLWQRTGAPTPDISHNVFDADESIFMDVRESDFHLNALASQAIDMGISHADVPDDIDKQARPIGDSYDIGADEWEYPGDVRNDGMTEEPLLEIRPNPFSQFQIMNYELREAGYVSLKVYDVFGNEVRTLVDEYQAAGRHSAVFRSENLLQGVYYYRIQIGGQIESGKLVLVR